MKHELLDYFSRLSPLSEEEARAILDSMVVRTFKIFRPGRLRPAVLRGGR